MKEIQALMSAVGRKRFILLVILIAINGVLAGSWQKILIPKQEELSAELTKVQSERSKLQTDIRELPAKHAALEQNETRYDALQKHGLFSTQDRIEARTRMELLRQDVGLRGVNYTIDPQSIIDTPSIAPTNNQLVLSRISVDLRALNDGEVLAFLDKMKSEFNGLIVLKDVVLNKENEVDSANLMKLKNGETTDFVSGKASFEWYSISPKTDDKSSPLSQAFQGSLAK